MTILQDAAASWGAGRPWVGLPADALAFVVSQQPADASVLVVADARDRAERLYAALRFFCDADRHVVRFWGDDGEPYNGFAPTSDLERQRITCMERADAAQPQVVVATVRGLMGRVPAPQALAAATRRVRVGDRLDRDALIEHLAASGYLRTARADAVGRVAIRGDVVDVWPVGGATPIRMDFFDDEVESLRRLDPTDLRPSARGRSVTLRPASECVLDASSLVRARAALETLATEGHGSLPQRRRVLDEWAAGIRFGGIQDWLPVFSDVSTPLERFADYETVVLHPEDVAAAAKDLEDVCRRRYAFVDERERPMVPPDQRWVPADDVLQSLDDAQTVRDFSAPGAIDFKIRPSADFVVRGTDLAPLIQRLQALVDEDVRLALVVSGDERAQRVVDMLETRGLRGRRVAKPADLRRGRIGILEGELFDGFDATTWGWAFLPVASLFGAAPRPRTRTHGLFAGALSSIAQLRQDDVVVHRRHGVGVYRGMVRLDADGIDQDYIKLEYRHADLLYLPVSALDQISPFAGGGGAANVTLDRLGGATWVARKGKVRDRLMSMAHELLSLRARRTLAERKRFPPPGERYIAFENRFPFVETPDQLEAIGAVLDDLASDRPMDRLICGDVGFGKTEVAMRAAMRTAEAGEQVLVLCPTTVLAHQHFQTFTDRFGDDLGIRVGMLSRFSSGAQADATREGLASGELAIVVGTTALLGRGVHVRRLGLVVVDEEHRFGVATKERLKKMRADVHMLCMSATPIPRTLQMALSAVQDISLITTPPSARLQVRTEVARSSRARVRALLLAEWRRGGQSYIVHNRVATIERFASQMREWVPEVRIGVVHGQMESTDLEARLVRFVRDEFDVLVCSAIVESGIDLPNVNTMLIDRADRFGLAQLHQLRGRVGRSDRRAVCVLLVPDALDKPARERISVLVNHQELGSGFQIASSDLELRGGGNILGTAQSGNIDQVGYETWVQLVDEAVALAQGMTQEDAIEPEVETPVSAFLPDDLVRDPRDRLEWYRRIADAPTPEDVSRTLADLEAEVGPLPKEAEHLGELIRVRLACRALGIERCAWHRVNMALDFVERKQPSEAVIAALQARHPKRWTVRRSAGRVGLSVRFTPAEGAHPFRVFRWAAARIRESERT